MDSEASISSYKTRLSRSVSRPDTMAFLTWKTFCWVVFTVIFMVVRGESKVIGLRRVIQLISCLVSAAKSWAGV